MTSNLPMKAVVFLILASILYFLGNDRHSSFLSQDNHPTKLLYNLFTMLDIKVDKNATLKEFNELSQANFLRSEERWNIPKKFEEKRKPVLDILKKAGWIDAIQPAKKEYDYVIIFGATVGRMEARIHYLTELQKKGLRFKKIIVLTGDRPLDPSIEPSTFWPNDIKPIPTNESEAAKALIESTPSLKKTPTEFIATSMRTDSKGNTKRPNTADSIYTWLDLNPEKGSILAISNQPYCAYQHAVLMGILKQRNFETDKNVIETVGPEAPNTTPAAVHLDNLARYLYTISQNELKVK